MLASEEYAGAKVFNKSKWFAMFKPSSITGDRMNFSEARTGMAGSALFSSEDEVFIAKACSLKERRSDCNFTINYLENLSATHFPYGGTISRRMYLYLPSITTLPNITLKLGYAQFDTGNKCNADLALK